MLCGVGLLTTPYAAKQGGWLGLLLLFLFGSISFYTGVLLKRCLDSAPGLQTYPDIGQAAFGKSGRVCISVSIRNLSFALYQSITSFRLKFRLFIDLYILESFDKCFVKTCSFPCRLTFFFFFIVTCFVQIALYLELYVSKNSSQVLKMFCLLLESIQ